MPADTAAARTPADALWPLLAAAGFVAAYAVLSHWLMVHAAIEPWAVAALFGPLLGAVALSALKQQRWWTLAFCAGVALLLARIVAAGGVADMNRMYVLQHAAVHAALAWAFAGTLRAGATPLISALAARLHGSGMTQAIHDYTRALTRAWVLFFVAMIGLSLTIYALAPWPWWSFFCNLLTPLAAVAFFFGEMAWRRWRHPEFERVPWRRAVAAWREHGAAR
jgi:uncharacterized membrane protein